MQTAVPSSHPSLQGYRQALPLHKLPQRSLRFTAAAEGWGAQANLWLQTPAGGKRAQTPVFGSLL